MQKGKFKLLVRKGKTDMCKQISEAVLQKNSEILMNITSDLIPVIADELNVGFHEADEIVQGTELYRVLLRECLLQDDYSLEGLKLLLRKELVRVGEHSTNYDNLHKVCWGKEKPGDSH